MDFLDVDLNTLNEPQAAPGSTDSKERFRFVQGLYPGRELFIDHGRLGISLLVVGRRSGKAKPFTEFGDRRVFSRRDQSASDRLHEFTSGCGFPCKSQAIL